MIYLKRRVLGLGDSKLFKQGIGFLVSSASYQYKKPTIENQVVEIHSEFVPYEKGVKIYMEHIMYFNDKILALAKTEHFFVNLKNNKSIKPLKELIEILRE